METRNIGDMPNDNYENFSLGTPLNEYYENIENDEYSSAFDKFGKNNVFINNLHLHNDSGYSKVVSEEKLNEKEKKKLITKKRVIIGGLSVAAIIAFIACWNRKEIENYFNEKKNNDSNTTVGDTILEGPSYAAALADNVAIIDEEAPIDEVVGDRILAFTDAYDDEQVLARAHAINIYLQKSNVKDFTDEELCDQIKFINGTYNASTDDEAYDKLNECLETFGAYSIATEQSANFAGGVVDDNGVIAALGLSSFLTDNCEHSDLMEEVDAAFINVLKASTTEEKVEASKTMLKLEADLMLGQKETPNGTKLYFHSLTSSEAFITGIMFQIANPIIHSALGENIEITYTDNMGQEVHVKYETLNEYYNPQCNGEYHTENAWAIVNTDLIETAIGKGHTYTHTW